MKRLEKLDGLSVLRELSPEELAMGEGPFTRLYKDMLIKARDLGASDIHIEPNQDGVKMLFRIDGERINWKQVPKDSQAGLFLELKRQLRLPVASIGQAHDSSVEYRSWGIRLRVNIVPVLNGEKIVCRIARLGQDFDLAKSNLGKVEKTALQTALSHKNGVVLITGPTGSGKTTTLYSMLHSLNSEALNISTLEDPVEITLAGLNQCEVTDDYSFNDGLRAFLRQDPDVIFVGEIRDQETANLAFKASSTGHLVFSTLHTNSAASTIVRLLDLGVDEFTLRSNLRFVGAQRLVKSICKHCSTTIEEQALVRRPNRSGCTHCSNGFKGRQAILEYIDEDRITNNSFKNMSPNINLFESAMAKVKEGLVDIDEALTYKNKTLSEEK